VDQILSRADGVPLFLEELTKTVLESDFLERRDGQYVLSKPLPALAIPTTLYGSLMARLDRSALAKEIAQIGAAIGREFSYALLHAVAAMDEAVLNEALGKLEEANLASCRGRPPEATYSFRHALVQDTAYASLLKTRRQTLHQQIAEALRDRFSPLADAEPEIIAHHFTQAGIAEQAVEWWTKAGELALRRSAYVEAVSHYDKAIGQAEQLSESPLSLRRRLRSFQRADTARPRLRQHSAAPANWRRQSTIRRSGSRSITAFGPAVTSAVSTIPWPRLRKSCCGKLRAIPTGRKVWSPTVWWARPGGRVVTTFGVEKISKKQWRR
jgi:predicted ATPase